jgi:hypothetical protein
VAGSLTGSPTVSRRLVAGEGGAVAWEGGTHPLGAFRDMAFIVSNGEGYEGQREGRVNPWECRWRAPGGCSRVQCQGVQEGGRGEEGSVVIAGDFEPVKEMLDS